MDDNFLVKLTDTNGEVQYLVLCESRKDLGNLVANLDEDNYVIEDVQNIGCLVQDWKDFVKRKGEPGQLERNV